MPVMTSSPSLSPFVTGPGDGSFVSVTNGLKEGDEVSAVVVNVDRKSRNIQLSIKAKDAADQQEAMASLSQNSGNAGTTSLGALLRAKLDNAEK